MLSPFTVLLMILATCLLGLVFYSMHRVRKVMQERDQKAADLQDARGLLHILTHDLSGTLFIIQSMAELQGTRPLDSRVHQAFARIFQAADSAQAMLKTVKELEAIEAGKVDFVLKPVPLGATLQATLDRLQPLADAKQIRITLVTDVPVHLRVLAEPTLLEYTILHNLLVNAIKFSRPQDTIEILVNPNNEQRVAVHIKDHGMGIPEGLLLNLFSPSGKTNRPGTAGEKGTGLGLPLVQRYVNKLGGTVAVRSQAREDHPDDHWTEFTVTLKKAG
ncbi:sensor histidine kinase [Oligoflexus tunisiensis]|uniref:sensor histidine kinase n=1 Tax=Oligoflexus tunisiensis TaxID=708132 RepID=UPI00114C86EC|nr:HAMP domain-containing sensor histidine kinase [Oligoflexus tunisiensis]